MSVLVIGGAGYIGSHCCKLLHKNKIKHVVLDDLSTGHAKNVKWGKLYQGDLADKELLKRIFKDEKIETVMHFAAFAYVGESVENPSKYYHNNVAKVIDLLDQMIESKIYRFIFSSTCATYGIPSTDYLTESHQQKPINPYGKTKLMVEEILKDYDKAYNLKSVAFRYFNAAGADPESEIGEEHNPETHLIPLVLKTAKGERRFISVFGDDYDTKDGTCIRDYIHVNDLALAHILGIDFLKSFNRSEQFNLGNGNGFSVMEIINIAEEVSGKEIEVKITERRKGDPARLIGDAGKAKKDLGWVPFYTNIKEIVRTAWDYEKKH